MKYNGIETVIYVERVFHDRNELNLTNAQRSKAHKNYASIAKTLYPGQYAYVRVELANSKVKIPGFGTLGYGKVERNFGGWTEPKFLAPEY